MGDLSPAKRSQVPRSSEQKDITGRNYPGLLEFQINFRFSTVCHPLSVFLETMMTILACSKIYSPLTKKTKKNVQLIRNAKTEKFWVRHLRGFA